MGCDQTVGFPCLAINLSEMKLASSSSSSSYSNNGRKYRYVGRGGGQRESQEFKVLSLLKKMADLCCQQEYFFKKIGLFCIFFFFCSCSCHDSCQRSFVAVFSSANDDLLDTVPGREMQGVTKLIFPNN